MDMGSNAATPSSRPGDEVPDLDPRPVERELRSSPGVSGARRAVPQSLPQGYAASDPQDLFGAGTFDADFFGDTRGPALEVDAGHGSAAAHSSVKPRPASSSGVELHDGAVGNGDPFANYGSGNLDFGDFDDAPSGPGDPFDIPLSLAEPSLRDIPRPAHEQRLGSGPRAAPRPGTSNPPSAGRIAVGQPREYPLGDTPAPSELAIDPIDVGLAADFGKPPSGWPLAAVYAWKVFMRRREIAHEIQRCSVRLKASEAARDTALAEFAQALRPAIEADTAAVRMLGEVQSLEQVAGDRLGTFQAVERAFEAKCGALDQADIDFQLELEELRQRTSVLDHDAAEARSAYKRAEIGYKRVEIELRAARERAARGAADGADCSHAEMEIAELELRLVALAPDVEAKSQALAAREAPLKETLERVRSIERDRAALASERKQAEADFKRQAAARRAGVSDVQGQVLAAMTEVGREILRRPGRVEVSEAQLSPVKAASDRVFDCAVELELWVRASASYEILGYRRGVQVIVGSVALFVLFCVLRIVL